ncbi:thymidylate synthase [Escherichia phage myPSH2311]|nr:thymidylate synthase [Escherichia phage myPSH2311]AVQ10062.1 thymidylate synthase [Escherichia phage myPSH1131]
MLINDAYEASLATYDKLIEFIAPEQARFVLPQGMITEWVWTGSLYGWFELCRQRLSSHAQYEVRVFAKSVDEEMAKLYPISWAALKKTLES